MTTQRGKTLVITEDHAVDVTEEFYDGSSRTVRVAPHDYLMIDLRDRKTISFHELSELEYDTSVVKKGIVPPEAPVDLVAGQE